METKNISVNISGLIIVLLIVLVGVFAYLWLKPSNSVVSTNISKYEADIAKKTALVNTLTIENARLKQKDTVLSVQIVNKETQIVSLRRALVKAVSEAHNLSKDSANSFIIGAYNIPVDSLNIPKDAADDIAADKVELEYLQAIVPQLDSTIFMLHMQVANQKAIIDGLEQISSSHTQIIADKDAIIQKLKRQRVILAVGGGVLIVVAAIL